MHAPESASPGGHPLHAFLDDYAWIHPGIGTLGDVCFLAGSAYPIDDSLKTAGVGRFIVGAAGMPIGSVGSAVVKIARSG